MRLYDFILILQQFTKMLLQSAKIQTYTESYESWPPVKKKKDNKIKWSFKMQTKFTFAP